MAADKPPSSGPGPAAAALTPADVTERKRRIAERSRRHPYRRQTNLSLIVLSFNHRSRIESLLLGMRRTGAEEVVVCEDGSWDGSLDEWDRLLDRRNDLLLRSNDLHEIRAYDRAIRLASAPIVCLLQDDDRLPDDGGWAAEALALFAADPRLAIVSGYFGWLNGPHGTVSRARQHGIPYRSPVTGAPFMYVAETYIGPFFVRRDFYDAVGGFDHAYSEPGEPGILFEADLCWRAWLAGWRVGLVDCFVKGDAEGGGVIPGTLWSSHARQEAGPRNRQRLSDTYRSVREDVARRIEALNRTQLVAAEPARVATPPAPPRPRPRPAGLRLIGGAVAYRGVGILVIGQPGSGTSRLVAALMRAGAAPIADGSVEVDVAGRIVPPPSGDADAPPAARIPLGLIVAAAYRADAHWAPREMTGARAALLLLSHAVGHADPRRRLRLASRLTAAATTLSGPRPDAAALAPKILAHLDPAGQRDDASRA